MVTKNKLLRFLMETRVISRPGMRRMTSKPAGLYLLQLRSHVAQVNTSKARLQIVVQAAGPVPPQPAHVRIFQRKGLQ